MLRVSSPGLTPWAKFCRPFGASRNAKNLRGSTMKSYTEYLWFNTKKQREFINITDEVEKALENSQIK